VAAGRALVPDPSRDAQAAEAAESLGERASGFADAAESLWHAGLVPLPVGGPDGKRPLLASFTRWRSRPPLSAIQKWAREHPQAGLGVVTGRLSNLVIADADDMAAEAAMIELLGASPIVVATSRGSHRWFRWSGERCLNLRRLGINADLKGGGGFALVPPTIRPDGGRYRFRTGGLADLGRLPPIKAGALDGLGQSAPVVPLHGVREGHRNSTLLKAALRHARHADDLDTLVDAVLTTNDTFMPPLPPAEAERVARSAWRLQIEGRNWSGSTGHAIITGAEARACFRVSHGEDAIALLTLLRLSHAGSHRPFPVAAEAMAEADLITGWGPRRYWRAARILMEVGMLSCTRPGGHGAGDVSHYTLAQRES
jgi:hypothetical protein